MPQAQPEWNSQSDAQRLESTMDKLRSRGQQHRKEKYGLSSNFASQVESEGRAMALCEEAMATLAGPFVDQLVTFREAQDSLHALASLEAAETLWQGESVIISQFDESGEEQKFLGTVRKQAYSLYTHKLEEVARKTKAEPTPDNIALCMALLGVMDSIQESFGVAVDDPERKRFSEIAKSFK